MGKHPEPSEALHELASTAFDHAASDVARGDMLIPFLLELEGEELSIRRHMPSPDSEEIDVIALAEKAQAYGRERVNEVDAVAVVIDGMVTIEGKKFDCMIAQVMERDGRHTFTIGQRYQPPSKGKAFMYLNDPFVMRVEERE
jgi:hypothetical protein